MTDVAISYARAVFSLALERNIETEILKSIQGFKNSLGEEEWKFFLHPKITKVEKHQVLEALNLDNLTLNFLKVLIDNSRFALLENIIVAYLELLNDLKNVALVKVFTKLKLSETNLEKLEKALVLRLHKQVKIEEIMDQNLIGGIKIVYQGEVIDLTIKSLINDIKTQLTGGN